MPEIILDVETKKSFDEVGGRQNFHLLEISLVGVYNYADDSYRAYLENELGELEKLIARADRVIGFNTKGFDYAVMQPYMGTNLKSVKSLDLMEEAANVLGHRISLDSIAGATLGAHKTGDGLKAIRLYREGKIKELADYCLQDVKLTREIYEYGAKNAKLFFLDFSGGKREVPVSWVKLKAEDAPLRLPL